MGWNFTDDVEVFVAKARPLLASDPVRNTVPLTVLDSVREGPLRERQSAEPLLFGWFDAADDSVAGAVLMTPPYELLLAVVPGDGVGELVEALRAHGALVPGVNGEVDLVHAFSAAWLAGTSQRAKPKFRMRLYGLHELIPPPHPAQGRARLAVEEDVQLAVEWFLAFQEEVGAMESDLAASVRHRISGRRMWLWEDESGEIVSLAARQKTAAGVARIGPVYTPPQQRGRGYAAAVTAACTRDALQDAERVVLFTDLANPTSNSIYQQIGYRPVVDRVVMRFVADENGPVSPAHH